MHVNAVIIGAVLAGIRNLGRHDVHRDTLQFLSAVAHNDDRRIAAQLKRVVLNGSGPFIHNLNTSVTGTDQSDHVGDLTAVERTANFACLACNDVNHTVRQADALGNLTIVQRRKTCLAGGLEHDRTAGCQRRAHF